ncbi:MAG TPA: aminoacyl-tRNA hydrolase [Gammaproteobacteria bacterium]|nr:aminoacyl-tRNA hydrolase [Gammaproteobacteria bacterium]
MPAEIRLVVGLGNPGPDYAHTRHNAGYWFVDQLAQSASASFKREAKFHGEVARMDAERWLLKPATFMNLSGDAAAAMARFYHFEPRQILVAHDDLDLPPGNVRFKTGGGDGGHNGLKDITSKLGSGDYHRLRFGIGHPGDRERVMPHVLNRATAEDEKAIRDAIASALAEMPSLLAGEYTKVMNALNRRATIGKETGEEE